MTYTIAGSIHVDVESGSQWAVDLLESVGAEPADASCNASLYVSNVRDARIPNLRQLEEGLWIGQSTIVDLRYGVRIEKRANALHLFSKGAALEWLLWLLAVSAIRSGRAFVHGAGMEFDGKVILFPSWGGVGKTALASGFIKDYGWKLLGDDLVLVQEDGACYPYPKPMVLYPYHRTVFPDVFANGRGPIAPTFMNEWLSSVAVAVKPILRTVPALLSFARKHNPQSVRVSPAEVFGHAAVSDGGRIHGAIWLERLADIDEPQIESVEDTLVSRIIGSTINEFDPHCVRLTNTAMGLGMIRLDEYISRWKEILEDAFRDVPQHVVNLPASMPVAEVSDAIRSALNRLGLW